MSVQSTWYMLHDWVRGPNHVMVYKEVQKNYFLRLMSKDSMELENSCMTCTFRVSRIYPLLILQDSQMKISAGMNIFIVEESHRRGWQNGSTGRGSCHAWVHALWPEFNPSVLWLKERTRSPKLSSGVYIQAVAHLLLQIINNSF